ncbi:MAG: alpha/beta hydrolase [Bdellovibrionales bacterium]
MKHLPLLVCTSLFYLFVSPFSLQAQEKKAQGPKSYRLWQGDAPGAKGDADKDIPSVLVYLPPADKANGAAVVICPGGGYGHLAIDHEGHQIARWLNSLGVAGIILKYRIAPQYHHPAPLTDAQRAVRFTRAHARDWNIDPTRVGIIGFSAGGHLASSVATHFDRGDAQAKDAIDRQSCRPDFAILGYAVITLKQPYTHGGSRRNLLGDNPNPKLLASLCNDEQVTKDTPPTFLIHTTEDKVVPPQNSVLFYLACCKAGVPAELHIYEQGRHGLGLGPANMAFSSWPQRCQAWLNSHSFLKKKDQ